MGTIKVTQQQLKKSNDKLKSFADHPALDQLVLVFGSLERLEEHSLVDRLRECHPGAVLAGCTTAGEILDSDVEDDTLTLTSLELQATTLRTHRVRVETMEDSFKAGEDLVKTLLDENLSYLLILSDGLAVNGSALVAGICGSLPPHIPFSGGLAGNGAEFKKTLTLDAEGVHEKCIVGVGFYGNALKVGRGSVGGWSPFGPRKMVTRSRENIVYEIDEHRALDVYSAYLGDEAEDLPASGLLFPLAIMPQSGKPGLIRTLLAIDKEQGSLTFAGDIRQGTTVQLMHANYSQLIEGAGCAAGVCLEDTTGDLDFALLISCVGRKLMLGNNTDLEVDAVMERFGQNVPSVGFYSYGEIGPFGERGACALHNQTMTVTVFSEREV